MDVRLLSSVAFVVAVIGILALGVAGSILAVGPIGIAVQVAAVAMMIWARVTFGLRSFHLTANTTEGGLVTGGPYSFLRHPIYAAVIWFVWAGALSHISWISITGAAICTVGLAGRMFLEERELRKRYPEYPDYMERTKRVVPFVV